MPNALETLFGSFLAMGIPAYDCLIYRNGREVYRQMAGFSDYEKKTQLHGQEWYNVYSVSKLVTATAALQLVEQGVISLQDRLSDYMPEFARMQVKTGEGIRDATTPITIEHLLTMTAGFNYDRSPERPAWMKARASSDGNCPTVKTLRFLADEPLEFEPGTDWTYSFGLDILTAVVELVSGDRFGEYAKKHIFVPLGMTHSTFSSSEIPGDRICAQYRYDDATQEMINCGKEIQNGFKFGEAYESGGAGCLSTTEDFILLLESLRKGEILKPETVTLMSTDHLRGHMIESFQKAQADDRYGYGLGVGCPNGTPGWTNFGWGGAAGAYCAIDRTNNLSIFYVQHVLNRPNKVQRREIYPAAKRMLNISKNGQEGGKIQQTESFLCSID